MAKPAGLFPDDQTVGMITDLYELTMAAGYFLTGRRPRAVFEALVRVLPDNRSFLVAAGLEQALHYLTHVSFNDGQIDWLRRQPALAGLDAGFFDYLAGFRFEGDVWAVPEGTVVFAGEPLVRIEADLIEAQMVETYLLTCLNLQTLVASKSARINLAAAGRSVVDFGARRAHGPQAGLLAARAALIGGCSATSNVLAGQLLGASVVGTQAHSWIMAFDDEGEAFEQYARIFGDRTVCLVDTYNTIEGTRKAARLGKQLAGVRLDSGDMVKLSKQVRRELDRAGCQHTEIIASGDLNEYVIADLLAAGAPIDTFGVGTDLVTSRDAPALSVVYKVVAVERDNRLVPVIKRSADKQTLGWAKQVFRSYDADGAMSGDVIGLADEDLPGEPLLCPVMRQGKLSADPPPVAEIADRCRQQLERLPRRLRQLAGGVHYPVGISAALQRAQPNPDG